VALNSQTSIYAGTLQRVPSAKTDHLVRGEVASGAPLDPD
jgi:hypothetical protein